MRKLVLVFVGLFLLAGNTNALADYCDHLETEIDRMLKSLNGLTEFVNGNHLSLMQCNMDPELTFEHNRAECTHKYGSRGAWIDFESNTTIYVIFTKNYIRELAQNENATNAMLDRSFKEAERIKNKIYWGGVIPSLRTEVYGWIDEYNRACTPIQLMQHVQPKRLRILVRN